MEHISATEMTQKYIVSGANITIQNFDFLTQTIEYMLGKYGNDDEMLLNLCIIYLNAKLPTTPINGEEK